MTFDPTNPAHHMRGPVLILSAIDTRKVLRDPQTAPRVKGVLSISDPPEYRNALRPLPQDLAGLPEDAVLCVDFLDKINEGFGGPEPHHVDKILAWGRRFHDAFNNPAWPGFVIIHCFAGISRSTAAALACFAQALGPGGEHDAVRMAYCSSAERMVYGCDIAPNELLIAHADKLLNRNGAIVRASAR